MRGLESQEGSVVPSVDLRLLMLRAFVSEEVGRWRLGGEEAAAVVVVPGVLVVVWLGLLLWRIAGDAWGRGDLSGEMLRLEGWRELSRLGLLTDCRHERMRSEDGCWDAEMRDSR